MFVLYIYIYIYVYVYMALFGPTHFKQNKCRNQELYLKHSKTGMTISEVDLRQTSPHVTSSPSFGTHPNQWQAWSVQPTRALSAFYAEGAICFHSAGRWRFLKQWGQNLKMVM